MLKRLQTRLTKTLPGGLKLWVTLLTLGFVGWALAGHAQGLRELSISARGWWWLVTGLGLSWLSLVVNALAWKVLVAWLGHGSARCHWCPCISAATC